MVLFVEQAESCDFLMKTDEKFRGQHFTIERTVWKINPTRPTVG